MRSRASIPSIGSIGANVSLIIIALCVSAEHSYSFPSRHRLRVAIEEYQKSLAKLVDDAVEQIVKDKTSDSQLSDTLIKLVAQSSLLSKE